MGRRPFVKQRILEAAFDLVARRGWEAVSTRDIATQADVGHASMYRHFASKEDLGHKLYHLACEPLLRDLAALDTATGPRDALRISATLLYGWYDERPRALALIVFPPHDFLPAALDPDRPDSVRSILQAAWRVDDDSAALIWGALTGPLIDRYLRHRDGTMTPLAHHFAERLVGLLDQET